MRGITEGHRAAGRSASSGISQSDEALMHAYVAGDHAAFRRLFDRHAPALRRAIRHRVRDSESAADVVQVTLLRAHRARHSFRGESAVRCWLFAIAMNAVREHHRRLRRSPELPRDVEGHASRQTPVETVAHCEHIAHAFEALVGTEREAVWLRVVEGRSYREIASVVGANECAVRVRVHRGLMRMRASTGAREVSCSST